jgi:hypothetical protein
MFSSAADSTHPTIREISASMRSGNGAAISGRDIPCVTSVRQLCCGAAALALIAG